MKMVITALGSGGDVFPFLALGQTLQQRGHTVTLLVNPHFAPEVAQAGLSFIPVGTEADYLAFLQHPQLWHPRRGFARLWRSLIAETPALVALLEAQLVPGQTVLVGSTLSLATRLVQERRGVPAAMVHLAPSCFLSAHDFPTLATGRLPGGTPLWARRLLLAALDRGWLDATCAPSLNAVRATLGLPPVRSVMRRWLHSPDLTLGAFPTWWAAPQPDWPASAAVTGFLRWRTPDTSAWPATVETFLAAGPPPLVFTAGTGMAQAQAFFACARQVTGQLGQRALFVTRFAETLPPALPSSILSLNHLPFERLLPRAAALIHHGGIGTVAAALAAGIPQLIIPLAFDQFDNARRAQDLGVAHACPRLDPGLWTSALGELLNPGVARRDALAEYRSRMADAPDAGLRLAEDLEHLGFEAQRILRANSI